MGNLKDRESRRRASVVGSIIEQQPAEETTQRSAGRGRPKEDRELRKRACLCCRACMKIFRKLPMSKGAASVSCLVI